MARALPLVWLGSVPGLLPGQARPAPCDELGRLDAMRRPVSKWLCVFGVLRLSAALLKVMGGRSLRRGGHGGGSIRMASLEGRTLTLF